MTFLNPISQTSHFTLHPLLNGIRISKTYRNNKKRMYHVEDQMNDDENKQHKTQDRWCTVNSNVTGID